MNTQTNSALHGLIADFDDINQHGVNWIFDNMMKDLGAFARALIAECCPDLAIVPRSSIESAKRSISLTLSALEFDEKLYSSELKRCTVDFPRAIKYLADAKKLLAATQPTAQEPTK